MNLWDKCRLVLRDNKILGFPVTANQVTILRDPSAFYRSLLDKCSKAEKRIVFASLYIGTGPLEESLLAAVGKNCQKNPSLSVHILLDGLRGSRGTTNSRHMLVPLITNHGIKVSLFQTPRYRGLLRFLIPDRYNEILGVQHMKFYLFDDDLIITGANLSHDYFTKRQDRYFVINKCQSLCDFVEGLVSKVSDFSFNLNASNELTLNSDWRYHPVTSNYQEFVENARNYIEDFYEKFRHKRNSDCYKNCDTTVFPMLEMGPFGIHQDSKTTQELIESCPAEAHVTLATGYFNITHNLADSIVKRTRAFFRLLMAHPKANGFYNAKGPAGGITKGYSELAGRFHDLADSHQQLSRVQLSEFQRDSWTFHAKGLWLYPNASAFPLLTLIGSPNFGERSYNHDLECQFLLATSDPELQQSLKEECCSLYKFSSPYTVVERRRKPPLWVKVVLKLFKTYL